MMVPAGNKDKRLSSVNHTTKAIHRYHHHYQSLTQIIEKLKQRILKKIIIEKPYENKKIYNYENIKIEKYGSRQICM